MTESKDKRVLEPDGESRSSTGHLWYRRHALVYMGLGGLALVAGAGLSGLVRFGYPRVLFEPPTKFKAGLPEEYRVQEVSTRWIPGNRVWIVREKKGFYALLASCTHLGCTPRWLPNEEKFKCFCHGSGFHRDGVNYEGPAPRPLERVRIDLAEDGQIMIDTSVRFRYERGEWGWPGSFLKI